MILQWYGFQWLGANRGPSPIFIWRYGGVSAPSSTGDFPEKKWIGEIQQIGFSGSIDTSMGLS